MEGIKTEKWTYLLTTMRTWQSGARNVHKSKKRARAGLNCHWGTIPRARLWEYAARSQKIALWLPALAIITLKLIGYAKNLLPDFGAAQNGTLSSEGFIRIGRLKWECCSTRCFGKYFPESAQIDLNCILLPLMSTWWKRVSERQTDITSRGEIWFGSARTHVPICSSTWNFLRSYR